MIDQQKPALVAQRRSSSHGWEVAALLALILAGAIGYTVVMIVVVYLGR